MNEIKEICSTIAETAEADDIRIPAKMLSETFNIKSVKNIIDCEDLLYWLYLYDQKEVCFDLCNKICQIQFPADTRVFSCLISIHILQIRLLREKNLPDDAKSFKEEVLACYANQPAVLNKHLEGAYLYYKEIESNQAETDIELEKSYKLSQYQQLCFISELGGSEAFSAERAEKEMAQLKSNLCQLSQQSDKIKNEKNYSVLMQKGADDAEIEQLCAVFSEVKIPAEFIDFYKIHNGQIPYTKGIIDDFYELLSIDQIVAEWNVWKELILDDDSDYYKSTPDPGIKDDWYNLLWLPFASNGCGDNYCLDLDPSSEGRYGQVITMVHDDDIRCVEALSFTSFLENHLGKNYLERMK